MKRNVCRLVALIMVLCLVLTGCRLDFAGYFQRVEIMLGGENRTDFYDMVYTRPDVEQLQRTVDSCCEKVASASNLNAVVDAINEAYAPLDAYYTAYALSDIYYCKDLTDTYWAEEYAFCTENVGIVQAALDQFYRALAKCQFRDELEGENYFGADFFDNYEGESVYDEVFTALLAEEAMLESQYYAIWNESSAADDAEEFYQNYGDRMAQVFVELIAVRQEMAAHLGYESYPDFAYQFYHGRDYNCQQTTSYLADIRAELVPLYEQLCQEGIDISVGYCTEKNTLSYVESMANAMGGAIKQAYDDMVNYHLYDIAYSENKYAASFEIYIQGYYSPYLFINPTLSDYDKLTMAHEFGHFCCDYVTGRTGAGVDVAEIFSQGMEYLSLCYAENTEKLQKLKMVDCLSLMVEQAAYASFEQQVYDLRGEDLTTENVQALFEQVGNAYGFQYWGFDSRSYVEVTHFFTNPMYVISYVVSNDVALQLYQMELAQSGSGLSAMQEAYFSNHSGIVAFTRAYGLESPFADGRIASIKQTIQQVLN